MRSQILLGDQENLDGRGHLMKLASGKGSSSKES